MDPTMNSGQGPNYLEQAWNYWQAGEALEAGRLLYQALPTELRPKWACAILEIALRKSGARNDTLEQLIELGKIVSEWRHAKSAFNRLRSFTLQMEEKSYLPRQQELLCRLLYLGENVAKVIYNATCPSDPFDDDSGWWVASCLKDILDFVHDEDFAQQAWKIVSSQDE
jgi:hypothetical protein